MRGSLHSETSSYHDEPTVHSLVLVTFRKDHYLQAQVYKATAVSLSESLNSGLLPLQAADNFRYFIEDWRAMCAAVGL